MMTTIEKMMLISGARQFVVNYNTQATDVQKDRLSRVLQRTVDSTDGEEGQMLYVACQLLRLALGDTTDPPAA